MSYQKQNFANGEVLTASQLNHIEDGIAEVESVANSTKTTVDNIIDPTLSLSGKAADAAKVGKAVGQLKEDLDYINTSLRIESKNVISNKSDFVNTEYYRHDGTLLENNYFVSSDFIPCLDFKTISFNLTYFHYATTDSSNSNDIDTIVFFDENKNYIGGYIRNRSSGQGWWKGQCIIPDDAVYIKAQVNLVYVDDNGHVPNVTLYKESVPVDMSSIATTQQNKCYSADGTLRGTTGWHLSDYIPVEGFKSVTFDKAAGYHSSDTDTIESITFFNNTERVSGIFCNISDNNTRLGYGTVPIPPNANFMCVCTRNNEETPIVYLNNPKHIKNKIVCIGDSLTEGYIGSDVSKSNYPKYMQDELGIEYTVRNCGVGGSQAITWWNRWKDLLYLPSTEVDTFIIMLGLNGGMNNTFETDVDIYDNYLDYSDTVTGDTCKLIEWLQEQYPSANIIFSTPTKAGNSTNNEREAKNQIDNLPSLQERYLMPIIQLRNLMGVNEKNLKNWLSDDLIHGTPEMYKKMGTIMANQLKSII